MSYRKSESWTRWHDAMCDWLRAHNVDPHRTPIDAVITHDDSTDEWRIPQFRLRDGLPYVTEADDIAMCVIRRTNRAPLPDPA